VREARGTLRYPIRVKPQSALADRGTAAASAHTPKAPACQDPALAMPEADALDCSRLLLTCASLRRGSSHGALHGRCGARGAAHDLRVRRQPWRACWSLMPGRPLAAIACSASVRQRYTHSGVPTCARAGGLTGGRAAATRHEPGRSSTWREFTALAAERAGGGHAQRGGVAACERRPPCAAEPKQDDAQALRQAR